MKKAEKQAWVHGGIGLLVGVALTGIFSTALLHHDHQRLMKKLEDSASGHTHNSADHDDMTMSEMNQALSGKSGDEFDKTFLAMMIPHHEGATEMAELAKFHAKHEEIRRLANNILISQTNEIKDMQSWQKMWGYADDSTMMHEH